MPAPPHLRFRFGPAEDTHRLMYLLLRGGPLRPAMRQRADQRLDPPLSSPKQHLHLEPVVLGLHARRRLHSPQCPRPRPPVLAPQVPHHCLVAAPVAVVPDQELVDLSRLGWTTLARHTTIVQRPLDRLDRPPRSRPAPWADPLSPSPLCRMSPELRNGASGYTRAGVAEAGMAPRRRSQRPESTESSRPRALSVQGPEPGCPVGAAQPHKGGCEVVDSRMVTGGKSPHYQAEPLGVSGPATAAVAAAFATILERGGFGFDDNLTIPLAVESSLWGASASCDVRPTPRQP